MSITLVLYGDLIQKVQNHKNSSLSKLELNSKHINTVYDILKEINVNENEISHIFVNHKYCGPGKSVKDKDRVALFPKKMAIMFAEIPHSNSIEVKVKLSNDLRKYGPEESMIRIPEGSNLRQLLEKYNIIEKLEHLSILMNEMPCQDKNYVLERGDTVNISLK